MPHSLYTTLEKELASSHAVERKGWIDKIINPGVGIKQFFPLLELDQKTGQRFAWLLSELAELDPSAIFNHLPALWTKSNSISNFDFKKSFASYWLICGLPEENESEAIDVLFSWLNSSEHEVTIRSRSALILLELTKKYPELKNELKASLESQVNLHTESFKKRAAAILVKLGN